LYQGSSDLQHMPTNITSHRALLQHEYLRSGTFCLAGRLVPLVYMLGCQRCGTNVFYDDIMAHVRGASKGHSLAGEPDYYAREQHFFATDTWSRGVQHYASHFGQCPSAHAGYQFSIDATPAYLRKPIVAERLPQIIPGGMQPKLRFLLMLRDPADRLYAYWDAFVMAGAGVNNFDNWVATVMPKVSACQKRNGEQLWPPPDNCDADTIEGVAAGLYAYQLIYWLHQFDPKQFFVTTLSAYEKDTSRVLRDAAAFIGANTELSGSVRTAGETTVVKVMGGMSVSARKQLGSFYHSHNAQLIKTLSGQPKITFSPHSVKDLGIQWWSN